MAAPGIRCRLARIAGVAWRAVAIFALGCAQAIAQNYSDIWWNPAEPGWGLTLADHESQMFGVFYTYDAGGKPTWYVIPGGAFSDGKRVFAGDIYLTTGPVLGAFDPARVTAKRVGTARIDFAPPQAAPGIAMFSYAIDAVAQTRPIQRQPFGSAEPRWGVDATDLWWNPEESGWGIALAQHGNNVFGVLFAYDASGAPRWWTMPGATFGSDFLWGALFAASGTPLGEAYDPARGSAAQVGISSLAMTRNNALALSIIDGIRVTKAIVRQPFGTPQQPACTPSHGPVAAVLRASPVEPEKILWISPLGNLNDSQGHTLPTDHVYFYVADPDSGAVIGKARVPAFAPGDGVVYSVIRNDPEMKVFVRVSPSISYYLDHLIPEIAIAVGTRLFAGQRLGTTGLAYALDLGLLNTGVTQAFVNPSRYIADTLNADAPLAYFEEPMRSLLYSKVLRIGPDCDGRINDDIAGRLAGNWYFGDATLSFVYDTYDPAAVRLSVPFGVWLPAPGGVFSIGPADLDPAGVSVASGRVTYTLTTSRTGPPVGGATVATMLVQMLDDARIRVEVFPISAGGADFTANSRIFVR